jgi:hypothetical protein
MHPAGVGMAVNGERHPVAARNRQRVNGKR